MLSWDIALSFFGVAVVLALSPGPDNIFVLTQSAIAGRAAGMLSTSAERACRSLATARRPSTMRALASSEKRNSSRDEV